EEVAAAIRRIHEQEVPARPPEDRQALDQLALHVEYLQGACAADEALALAVHEAPGGETVNARMRALEPVLLARLIHRAVHLGGEAPAALPAQVEGDHLLIHAPGEEQLRLRPPVDDADLGIRL